MNYDGHDAIVRLALLATFHPEKDLKKLILKLLKKLAPHAAKGVTIDILNTKYKTYKEAIWKIAEQDISLSECATELSNEGFPGMVMYEGEAYGVQIFFEGMDLRKKNEPDKSDEQHAKEHHEDITWARNNEGEIKLAMLHAVMNHFSLPRIKAEVMLFTNRGFSGIIEDFEIERGVARKFNQYIGNSNYYI